MAAGGFVLISGCRKARKFRKKKERVPARPPSKGAGPRRKPSEPCRCSAQPRSCTVKYTPLAQYLPDENNNEDDDQESDSGCSLTCDESDELPLLIPINQNLSLSPTIIKMPFGIFKKKKDEEENAEETKQQETKDEKEEVTETVKEEIKEDENTATDTCTATESNNGEVTTNDLDANPEPEAEVEKSEDQASITDSGIGEHPSENKDDTDKKMESLTIVESREEKTEKSEASPLLNDTPTEKETKAVLCCVIC